METMVSSLRPTAPVEDALHQIRVLAARPALTAPHVLLAAVELLVEQAALSGHADAPFYSKALRACREMSTVEDLGGLCLKLFGSAEDKKISAALSEFAKSKRYALPAQSTYGYALPAQSTYSYQGYSPYRGQSLNRRRPRPFNGFQSMGRHGNGI